MPSARHRTRAAPAPRARDRLRWADVLASIYDGVVVLDADGAASTDLNPAAEQLLGVSASQAVGAPVERSSRARPANAWLAELVARARSPRASPAGAAKDRSARRGREVPVSAACAPVHDDAGRAARRGPRPARPDARSARSRPPPGAPTGSPRSAPSRSGWRTRSATRSAASRAPRSSCARGLADPEPDALHRHHHPRGRAARRPGRAAARARHAAAAPARAAQHPPRPERRARRCSARRPSGATSTLRTEFDPSLPAGARRPRPAHAGVPEPGEERGRGARRPRRAHASRRASRRASTSAAARDRGQFLSVPIADDGPGVPEDDQAHLFSPFFTTKARGTGLGLAVCHRIVSRARRHHRLRAARRAAAPASASPCP